MIENNKNSVFILFLFFGAFVECQNIGIVNGEIADIKNFPYQIAIWYRWPRYIPTSLRLHYFASGGTIIGDKWILTTAHSVEEGYDYYIRAGSSESNEGGETFEIEDIILNPDFNENDFTRRGDIAVLKLKEHITYSETMQRIVIADKYLNLYTNAKLKVSGYGQLGFLGPLEYKLRNYTAEFISMEECEGYCTYLPRDTLCLWDRKQISQSKLKQFSSIFI